MASNTRMQFNVLVGTASSTGNVFPRVDLLQDSWDDYTFKTTWYAILRTGPNESLELGQVKILSLGQTTGRTQLDGPFTQLDQSYCSLGQDIEYYEKLMTVDPQTRIAYLTAIRDAAANPAIEREFVGELGWSRSLLRFGQALNALSAGRQLLNDAASPPGLLSFRFNWRRAGQNVPVDFEFDDTAELPGRCHVLIGYNGVGKTTLLADLAMAASRGRQTVPTPTDPTIEGTDTTFGAVVAVSYSAFDTFATPDGIADSSTADSNDADPLVDQEVKSDVGVTDFFGYVYCGLRRLNKSAESPDEGFKLKSIDEIEAEFARALDTVGRGREESRQHLVAAFQALTQEPSFARAGVDLANLGAGLDSEGAIRAFGALSTGHKIVLNIVTQLAAHLRTRSLVLIDEPETHLHPPLMAALLRAVQGLLRGHNSFAVVATHSPVVVQEMQSKYVRVLERYTGSVDLRQPEIETFGENIGTITRHVFSLDSSATDFQGTLATLAERYTVDEIADLFGSKGISNQARALVLNYQANQ